MQLSGLLLALLSAPLAVTARLQARQYFHVDPIEEINSFAPTDALAKLASHGLDQIQELQAAGLESRARTCNLRDVVIRRDW